MLELVKSVLSFSWAMSLFGAQRVANALPKQTIFSSKQTRATPQDGRIEVATAIAAVSSLVTVDASESPFRTVPDNLFELTFNDPKVGVSDDQMRVFEANLSRLLPDIANDVAQLPATASLPIEQVADFVQVSLLSPGGKR